MRQDDGMYSLTVTFRSNRAEDIDDYFHLHYQAGGSDLSGCTVLEDGGRTLLGSEATPRLVFDD